jgi:archaeal flagellar protein FlaG
MGFSLTGTHVIFFVASVIVAGAVSGVFIAVINNVTTSFSKRGENVQEKLEIDYKIINDPVNIPTNDNYYAFYIKNIGSRKIVTTNNTFHIQIDGELVTKANYSFSPDSILSDELTILYIDKGDISAGDHKLKVVGPQDIYDEFYFSI